MYVCLGIWYYGKGNTPEEAYGSYAAAARNAGRAVLPAHSCVFVKGEEGTVREETITQLVFKESIKQ